MASGVLVVTPAVVSSGITSRQKRENRRHHRTAFRFDKGKRIGHRANERRVISLDRTGQLFNVGLTGRQHRTTRLVCRPHTGTDKRTRPDAGSGYF